MMESQKVCGKVELKDNFSAKTLETHAQFYFLNSMHFPSTSHVHGFQNFFFFGTKMHLPPFNSISMNVLKCPHIKISRRH